MGNNMGVVVPTWLANAIIGILCTGMLGLGVYMVQWNIADAAWKATVNAQLKSIEARMPKQTDLVRMDERIKHIEEWQHDHDETRRRLYKKSSSPTDMDRDRDSGTDYGTGPLWGSTRRFPDGNLE